MSRHLCKRKARALSCVVARSSGLCVENLQCIGGRAFHERRAAARDLFGIALRRGIGDGAHQGQRLALARRRRLGRGDRAQIGDPCVQRLQDAARDFVAAASQQNVIELFQVACT